MSKDEFEYLLPHAQIFMIDCKSARYLSRIFKRKIKNEKEKEIELKEGDILLCAIPKQRISGFKESVEFNFYRVAILNLTDYYTMEV